MNKLAEMKWLHCEEDDVDYGEMFGLVFKDNDIANAFWETQGYTICTNLNYRNKSLDKTVPQGE